MEKKVLIIVLTVVLILGVALIVGLAVGLTHAEICGEKDDSSSSERSASGHYRYATVTADNALCSSIGTEIMARHGGSSVDAAIATLICLGVVNPHHAGLGGGHLMVMYERPKRGGAKELKSLIARGTAPLWVKPDYFENDREAQKTGPMSISVPCEVKGYYTAWQEYGRVPWKDLFQHSIDLCNNGWEVTESMEISIQNVLSTIEDDEILRKQYIKDNGEPYKVGDIMTDPKLGHTLQQVADGPNVFYTGSLMQDIVNDIADAGGRISLADMGSTTANWWSPIESTVRNGTYSLFTPPPPSSGATVAFILNLLEQFDWSETDKDITDTQARANTLHRFVEAWSVAFALRNQAIGDRSFQTRNMKEWLDAFVNDNYAHELMEKLKNGSLPLDDYSIPADELEDIINGGTTHVNVLSAEGGAVAVTSTVGSLFGAKVRGNRTGLIFNNALSLFDLKSDVENSINHMYPRKRGRSSTSPVLVLEDDDVVMVTGSSGGTRIITATASVLAQTLLLDQTATHANTQPRVHIQYNSSLYYDDHMPQEVLDILREKGHNSQTAANEKYPYLAVNQVIDNRACITCGDFCMEPCIEAVSDWRKSGKPDGY